MAANGILIDAPAPRAPLYTLIGAARVVPMDDEHYLNGLAVRGYPKGAAHAWDPFNHRNEDGSTTKATVVGVATPSFQAFSVYMRHQCNSRGLSGAMFAEQVRTVFPAVEAYAVEREFYTGGLYAAAPNPSLVGAVPVPGGADSTVYPTAGAAQTPVEGLAQLEGQIALRGSAGVIHATPTMVTRWSGTGLGGGLSEVGGANPTLVTKLGTLVVPGYGYQGFASAITGSTPVAPAGQAAPTGTREWVFATGPIEVRRSQMETIPEATDEALWQALDRGTNLLTYEAVRHYVFSWDTGFKAAVLIDRAT